MRRALETAYNVFKDHPNFANLTFIVDPDLREELFVSCDVPAAGILRRLEYQGDLFAADGSTLLDTTPMQDIFAANNLNDGLEDLWIVGNSDPFIQAPMKEAILKNMKERKENAGEALLTYLEGGNYRETEENKAARGERVKQRVRDLIKTE